MSTIKKHHTKQYIKSESRQTKPHSENQIKNTYARKTKWKTQMQMYKQKEYQPALSIVRGSAYYEDYLGSICFAL